MKELIDNSKHIHVIYNSLRCSTFVFQIAKVRDTNNLKLVIDHLT